MKNENKCLWPDTHTRTYTHIHAVCMYMYRKLAICSQLVKQPFFWTLYMPNSTIAIRESGKSVKKILFRGFLT